MWYAIRVFSLLAWGFWGAVESQATTSDYWNYTSTSTPNFNQSFDYVIVGGGTAGLLMASRLSENASITVAVVEAGDFYQISTGNTSTIPANDALYNGKDPADTNLLVDWDFTTTPQAGLDNQRVHYARGKTLGGCSALNYMAYQRAPKGAFEKWAEVVGDSSWKYENVSEYYIKSLNFTPPDMQKRIANATPTYDESTLGRGGLLDVTYSNYAQGISTWYAMAFNDSGIPPINGFTSGNLFGHGWLLSAINHTYGTRASSEVAFLQPFLDRPNLSVFRKTLAEKIIFEGSRATGLQVSSENSTSRTASGVLRARKEVIVSAGTFQSPQLLQVSGVGPADVLSKYGIDIVADRPGVGSDMNDQIFFGVNFPVKVQTSTALLYGDALYQAEIEFDTQQNGLLASPGGDYAAYENVPADLRAELSNSTLADLATFPADWPELEYFSLPAYIGDFQYPPAGTPMDGLQYASMTCTLVAPTSRGNLSISSASMKDQPLINPNWLTTKTDQEVAVAGFKRLRQFFNTTVLKENLLLGPEVYPGVNVTTDAQILAAIKTSLNTMYHATSTCKMGKASDRMAVVDSQGRVYGTEHLRVVDASIYPFVPPSLPFGTVYMMAEKISDDIKRTWR